MIAINNIRKDEVCVNDVKPFIKWAGGKRQLIAELIKSVPKKYTRYYEPFIGGGAFFFHTKPDNAYISDINPDLINAYRVVKMNVDLLIEDLRIHKNTEEYYYEIRKADRTDKYKDWNEIQKASRLIYLNKTCFNGLYRMNSKGQFNVPFGSYKNPKIVDEENLRKCSKILQNTDIVLSTFNNIDSTVKKGDFVYFDPPYLPLNQTSSFTKYYKDDFNYDMQFKLRELCDTITRKNVYFMLSNSCTESILELYKKYKIRKVKANRAINCKGSGRGKINEVIVRNY